MGEDFMLPHEVLDLTGIPDHARAHVAYEVLAAKYCALVERVMEITGGEPVAVSLDRAKEILDQDPLTSDPRDCAVVVERKPGHAPGPIILVQLATPDEVRAMNRRYALHQMGARRN